MITNTDQAQAVFWTAVIRIERDRLTRRAALDATLATQVASVERAYVHEQNNSDAAGLVDRHRTRTLRLAQAKATHERDWRNLETETENKLTDAINDCIDAVDPDRCAECALEDMPCVDCLRESYEPDTIDGWDR
jgi:hypothetical protein